MTQAAMSVSREFIAQMSLFGMGLDVLGGCYLAYDLLGGKRGPLRTIARAISYSSLFFIGYFVVLGLRYAVVAATGMGILLAIEYRIAGMNPDRSQESRGKVLLFGFLRGVVLGIACITIAGARFGAWFGVLSGAGLVIFYSIGFAPTDDYKTESRPSITRHKIFASLSRAFAISVAGAAAALSTSRESRWIWLGLRLGLAAGAVSALVGLFSPAIEWLIDNLPERRLGVAGLGLIFAGMLLQSAQYWIVIFNVPTR